MWEHAWGLHSPPLPRGHCIGSSAYLHSGLSVASARLVCGVPPSHSTMGYQDTRAVEVNCLGQASLPCQGQIEQVALEVIGKSDSLIPPAG